MGRYHINIENKDSGLISSSQNGVHPRLHEVVCRHLQTQWQQPMHPQSELAYQQLLNAGFLSDQRPFVLDSGCGTGKSTQRLAELYPQHIVIGVDRSQARLSKSGADSGFLQSGNCILMRAELTTFWRLLLADGYLPERHYLFYPNPYPKPGHLSRRWHGHPVFPSLLALGGEIELRCNWKTYALEFAQAVNIARSSNVEVQGFSSDDPVSPFEHKYLQRGQQLYSVSVSLSGGGV